MLSVGWHFRTSSRQTSVRPQRSRRASVLSEVFRTYHSASSWPSLVAKPKQTQFRLDVYHCLNSTTPCYLAECICRSTDAEGRSHLHSSATSTLTVPRVQHSTLGDRAFSVATPPAWNSLPSAIYVLQHLSSPTYFTLSRSSESRASVTPPSQGTRRPWHWSVYISSRVADPTAISGLGIIIS